MLFTFVIMFMLLVIPCEPMPLSFRPCNKKPFFFLIFLQGFLPGRPLSVEEQGVRNRMRCPTWKGKWSGPRAGAELICTVPVSMASLIMMAFTMSLVKTHPCEGGGGGRRSEEKREEEGGGGKEEVPGDRNCWRCSGGCLLQWS